jgi:hypothetical protein
MGGRGRVMASWMASCDVYRCASLFIFPLFSNSESLHPVMNNGL